MAGEEAMAKSFRPEVALERPKTAPVEIVFAGAFYLTLAAQVVLAFVVLGAKNSDIGSVTAEGSYTCGRGLVPLQECGGAGSGFECVTDALCQEMRACAAKVGAGRQLALSARSASANLWVFLEEHAYVPTVLFLAVLLLSVLWLFLLQKAARPVIWGTIAADILGLVAVFVYMLAEHNEVNWMCIVFAVAGLAMAVWLRRQIDEAAVIMTWAMVALGSNRRLFLVCGGVTLLWGCYFALWVTSLISLFFVQEVAETEGGGCELRMAAWAGNLRWLWLLGYYWASYFFLNAKLLILAPQVAGWYFQQPGSESFWVRSTGWALGPLAGGNAICSAIMGVTQRLLDYHNSRLRLIAGLANPLEWVPLCLAFALKQCIFTYTRYGLIAQAHSGEPFCGNATKAFELLRRRLGEAFICNYLGSRVMAWCTWVLSLGVAFATWAWAEELQLHEGLLSGASTIVLLGLALAYFISMPSFTLALLVLAEGFLGNLEAGELRAVLNVVFASLFCGSVTHIILESVSHIVVNTMDVIFFCFAVEADNALKQDRFAKLYDSINKSVAPGCVPSGPGVAVGRPPTEQAAAEPCNNDVSSVGTAQPHALDVVGQPVPGGTA